MTVFSHLLSSAGSISDYYDGNTSGPGPMHIVGDSAWQYTDNDEYADTDTWTQKTDFPTHSGGGRGYSCACTIGWKGYLFLGSSTLDTYQEFTDEYDDTDTWTGKTDHPTPKYNAMCATVSRKAYVHGGFVSGLKECHEYDPDTWTAKNEMPYPESGGSPYGVHDHTENSKAGDIFIVGGRADAAHFEGLIIHNVSGDSYSLGPDYPAPTRWKHDALAVRSKIYVMFGEDDAPTYNTLNDCDELTTSGYSWASKTDAPVDRESTAAAGMNEIGYCVGGAGGSTAWVRNDEYNPSTDNWTNKTDCPSPGHTWGTGFTLNQTK